MQRIYEPLQPNIMHTTPLHTIPVSMSVYVCNWVLNWQVTIDDPLTQLQLTRFDSTL